MKITNVTIENFLGIGEAKINLQDKGLVLVQGSNLDDPSADSNGSGKSSMIDAVFWGLYGKTARGLAGDDVINRVVGKQCVVTVEFEDGTETASIKRWRKAKGFHKRSGVSLEINGADHSGGTDALTQAEIDKVIGCSEQVFSSAVYAGQEAMPDIPSMTDRQLKSLIEQAAGIDLIEQAYEIARENLRELSDKMHKADDANARAGAAVERSKVQISLSEGDIQEWEKDRENRITTVTHAANTLANDARSIKSDIDDFDEEGINSALTAVQVEIAALDTQLQDIQDSISGVKEEQEVAQKLAQKTMAAEFKAESERRLAVKLADEHAKHIKRYEDLSNTVGDPCGECAKEITADDIGPARKILKQKIADIKAEHQNIRVEYKKLAELHKQAEQAEKDHTANRTDISAQQAQQRDLLNKQRDASQRLKALSDELTELPALKREYTSLKTRYDEKREDIKRLKNEANPYERTLQRHTEDLAEAEKKERETESAFSEASKMVVIAKAAAEVFGPKGVRAHILDTVTPFLNDRTAHYLSTLSDGTLEAMWATLTETRTGELKEKFTIGVEKNGTGTFASLSGGEKRKVRLATTLALQDLVSSRATKPIHLWIGDEIDTALDPAGLERLMTLLEMKAREKGTVLIVSHHDLKDWVRDTVTVTMKDKAAIVEGVLCTH